ncbi:MAG: phosphoribosylglycinamide formyltransferase [Planctomycetaceae bacterium]|jgi:phosphoribosylglycinamide formyltransferase-1|nr:phosphoribosylglycinamide formyltransferase [Planctomycetaceae bacterium]
MAKRKLRLAVLISGTGRSLKNLINRISTGELSAEVAVVISSTPSAVGLQYAEEESIPIEIIERHNYPTLRAFSEPIFQICRDMYVDYVVLAGYLKLLDIPSDFHEKVLNIHPSLIPAFCGKGYYGNIVHSKVLEMGVKISGCTVHFVDEHYDNGPIILQKAVDVLEGDTADKLNDRVFAAECIAYPEALELLAEGRVTVQGRIVKIAPKKSPHALEIDF